VAHARFDRRSRAPARRWGEKRGRDAKTVAEQEALGRSRGGFSTKVHVVSDALGNPLAITLTGGQRHDITQAGPLLDAAVEAMSLAAEDAAAIRAVLADRGYDADHFVERIGALGAEAVIPSRTSRKEPREHDRELYKDRNKVERLIGRFKHYRRIATRYEKTARNYLAMLHLVGAMVWLL
jgi:transposase